MAIWRKECTTWNSETMSCLSAANYWTRLFFEFLIVNGSVYLAFALQSNVAFFFHKTNLILQNFIFQNRFKNVELDSEKKRLEKEILEIKKMHELVRSIFFKYYTQ